MELPIDNPVDALGARGDSDTANRLAVSDVPDANSTTSDARFLFAGSLVTALSSSLPCSTVYASCPTAASPSALSRFSVCALGSDTGNVDMIEDDGSGDGTLDVGPDAFPNTPNSDPLFLMIWLKVKLGGVS